MWTLYCTVTNTSHVRNVESWRGRRALERVAREILTGIEKTRLFLVGTRVPGAGARRAGAGTRHARREDQTTLDARESRNMSLIGMRTYTTTSISSAQRAIPNGRKDLPAHDPRRETTRGHVSLCRHTQTDRHTQTHTYRTVTSFGFLGRFATLTSLGRLCLALGRRRRLGGLLL